MFLYVLFVNYNNSYSLGLRSGVVHFWSGAS